MRQKENSGYLCTNKHSRGCKETHPDGSTQLKCSIRENTLWHILCSPCCSIAIISTTHSCGLVVDCHCIQIATGTALSGRLSNFRFWPSDAELRKIGKVGQALFHRTAIWRNEHRWEDSRGVTSLWCFDEVKAIMGFYLKATLSLRHEKWGGTVLCCDPLTQKKSIWHTIIFGIKN